jgi:regulator of CtrA degradation
MTSPAKDISAAIVESLYIEALVLADEARAIFDLPTPSLPLSEAEERERVAMSCEALRTTTRMMHAIAWLLNQRAFFAGELSAHQVERYGRLPAEPKGRGDDHRLQLADEVVELAIRTEHFYARVARLDAARMVTAAPARTQAEEYPGGEIGRLQRTLGAALGASISA